MQNKQEHIDCCFPLTRATVIFLVSEIFTLIENAAFLTEFSHFRSFQPEGQSCSAYESIM